MSIDCGMAFIFLFALEGVLNRVLIIALVTLHLLKNLETAAASKSRQEQASGEVQKGQKTYL